MKLSQILIFFFIGLSLGINAQSKEVKKQYQLAKKMKYCTQLKIIIDSTQYVNGEEKFIYYKIYSIHVRKDKTFTYLYSTKDDTTYNHISIENISIECLGVNGKPSENRILIQKDLVNCPSGEFSINVSSKKNPLLTSSKHIDLVQQKKIMINLIHQADLIENGDFIVPIFTTKDSCYIDLYFKKIISPFNKELIYITTINSVYMDTLTTFIDSTSSVSFTYYPNLFTVRLFVDENINSENLNFKLIRAKYNYTTYTNHHYTDQYMVINDLRYEKELEMQQEIFQRIADRENIQKKALPDSLFKR